MFYVELFELPVGLYPVENTRYTLNVGTKEIMSQWDLRYIWWNWGIKTGYRESRL